MSNVIQITSNNFNGQYADITFYPCSGGSISLGYQLLPYDYAQDNYEGTYDIYVSAYTLTCQLVIACPSPTPTSTTTPTITPTTTVTPTPTDPRTCRTYEIGNYSFCSNFTWTECDGSTSATTLCNGETAIICAKNGSVSFDLNGFINDIGTCPLPSPTPTPTTTVTPTPSVTPTLTPTPSPVVEYHLQAENTDNILAENSDFIDIEHT